MTDETLKSVVSNWARHQGDPSEQIKTTHTIGKLLAAVAERHLSYIKCVNEHFSYFPVPLVGLVLQQMREARPDAFSPLHIVARDIRNTLDPTANGTKQFIVWLPREKPSQDSKEPSNENLNIVWDTTSEPEKKADLFIARYVAAMVLGHAVSFAPREIVLDYYSKETRDSWSATITRALRENGWNVMEKYLEQVRCEPARVKPLPDISTLNISVSDQDRQRIIPSEDGLCVLGIDIGGTSIKIRLYKVTTDSTGNLFWASQSLSSPLNLRWEDLHLSETIGTKNDWPTVGTNGLRDTSVLIKYVIEQARITFGDIFDKCKAVGIAIAAPVSGGVPTATSRVLAYFQGITDKIVEGNPLKIHQLDFTAALKEGSDWTVVCLNDGEAEILDSDENVSTSAEGVSLAMKQGTGIAFAVHVDGRLIGIPGETAKAVLNLRSKPQDKLLDQRFQEEVVSKFCSQKAFLTLLVNGIENIWLMPDEKDSCNLKRSDAKEMHKWFQDRLEPALGEWLGCRLNEALNTSEERTPQKFTLDPKNAETFEKCFTEHGIQLNDFFSECVKIESNRNITSARRLLDGEADEQKLQQISQNLAQLHQEFSDLLLEQKFAVGCAWVLGRWLADAIALAVDIYGAGEVFLAGGPLSGKTGLFVTKSAELALRDVYGFDVLLVEHPDRPGTHVSAPSARAVHRHRQVRRLKLVYPPEKSSESGPRGAAKAAFDEHIRRIKAEQMRECRDWVVDDALRQAFSPREVCSFANKAWEQALGQTGGPWLLTNMEVESMLSTESSALGLTRMQDGRFIKYGVASTADAAQA